MSKESKLSSDVIKKWPDVLSGIDVKVVPVQYIKAIEVYFSDGNRWVLDVDPHAATKKGADLDTMLRDVMEEHEDSINGVNFVVDIDRVKFDIQKRTRQFMKKRK